MPKKVILYIGHHKVGSTALQMFFAQNWLALSQKGILYPSVEPLGMASNLKSCLTGAETSETQKLAVREPHNSLAFAMMHAATGKPLPPYQKGLPHARQMLRTLRAQVGLLNPETLVLCSEVMANFSKVSPDLIGQIAGLFPDAEVEIYSALRRPDQYLASWYGQRLKFGHQIEPLRDGGALGYRNNIHFDYAAMLKPWRRAFPGAKMILRNYSDVLKSGGAVEDFTAQVSVDFPEGLSQPERANPSLPYATMEIMRRANHELSEADIIKLKKFLLGSKKNVPNNADVELFGGETRSDLHEAFKPINEALCELSGGDVFFPDLDEMLEVHAQPEVQVMEKVLRQLSTGPKSLLLPRSVRTFMRQQRPS